MGPRESCPGMECCQKLYLPPFQHSVQLHSKLLPAACYKFTIHHIPCSRHVCSVSTFLHLANSTRRAKHLFKDYNIQKLTIIRKDVFAYPSRDNLYLFRKESTNLVTFLFQSDKRFQTRKINYNLSENEYTMQKIPPRKSYQYTTHSL